MKGGVGCHLHRTILRHVWWGQRSHWGWVSTRKNPKAQACNRDQGNLKPCLWAHSAASDSLWPRGLQPTRLLYPWDFSSRNTGVGCHFLLQWIFLIHGLNPCLLRLLHWKVDSLPLSHLGSGKTIIKSICWYYCCFFLKATDYCPCF